LVTAALKGHPELASDPHRLAFVVGGAERAYNQPPAAAGRDVLGAVKPTMTEPERAADTALRNVVPSLGKTVAQGVNDVATALVQGTATVGQAGSSAAPVAPMAPATAQSAQRGAALIAAALAPMAVPALPASASLLARVGSAVVTDGMAGTAYGLIRPLGEGETREQAANRDARAFALGGQMVRATGFGVSALGRAVATTSAAHTVAEVSADMARSGTVSPAHSIALMDAATDVAASRLPPSTLMAPEQLTTATHDLPSPSLDRPLARTVAPYSDAPTLRPPSDWQQAARALPDGDVATFIRRGGQVLPDRQPLGETRFANIREAPKVAQAGAPPSQGFSNMLAGVGRGPEAATALENAPSALEVMRTPLASEAGRVSATGLVRATAFGAGAALRTGALQPDDSPGVTAAMNTVGGLLMLGSLQGSPALKAWASGGEGLGAGIAKRTAQSLDLSNLLTEPGAGGAFSALKEQFTAHELYLSQLEQRLQDAFGKAGSPARKALAYAAGPEGQVAGNQWLAGMTATQRVAVGDVGAILEHTGNVLEQRGLIDAKKLDYMPHVLPEDVLQAMRKPGSQAASGLTVTPGFTKSSKFFSLTELNDWLKSKGYSPAEEDGVKLVMQHMRSYFRVLRNDGLFQTAKEQGWLMPLERTPTNAEQLMKNGPYEGWRFVGIRHEFPKEWIAPNDVAGALEQLADSKRAPTLGWAAYDALQSAAMRTIMFNPVIHGMNEVRAALSAGISPGGLMRSYQMIARNDPFVSHMAEHGLLVGGRQTEGVALRTAFDDLFRAAGQPDVTRSFLMKKLGDVADWNEQSLFGPRGLVATTAVATAAKERAAFMLRNPSALPGSAEYGAGMRKIAQYANDVSGRVNQVLRSQGAKDFMQRVFFAPQWLETRWNLTLGALRELHDPAAIGSVAKNPIDFARAVALPGKWGGQGTDAIYLQYKARSLALAAASTYALSKVWSGRDPEWNDKSARFYAHTNLFDDKGREVGFDPAGIWDEDVRAFNNMGGYLAGKLSFALKALPRAAFSEDPYGKPLSAAENAEQFLGDFGGLASAAETTARMIAQGHAPNGTQALRLGNSLLGAGSAVTMPNPGDMLLAKRAEVVLGNVGLPADDARVWQLSQMLKYNIEHGRAPATGVEHFLGAQLQALGQKSPSTALLYRGLRALKELATPPAQ
jgi:hypothetical protein